MQNFLDETEKVLVAIPTGRGVLPYETVISLLEMDRPMKTDFFFIPGALISQAREEAVNKAIEEDYDYLVFLDDDMTFPKHTLVELANSIYLGADIASGLYVTKDKTHTPVVYGTWYEDNGDLKCRCFSKPLPKESILVNVAAVGTGCMMIKTSVLRKVKEEYGDCFSYFRGLGEDLSFCYKAKQLGYIIYLSTAIKCGHIGNTVFTIDDFDPNVV